MKDGFDSPQQPPLAAEVEALSSYLSQMASYLETLRGDPPLPDVKALSAQSRRSCEKLSLCAEKVAATRNRFWFALDSIRDGFAIFDKNLLFVNGNHPFRQFFGAITACVPGIPMRKLIEMAWLHGLLDSSLSAEDWFDRFRQPNQYMVFELSNGRHIQWRTRLNDQDDLVCMARDVTRSVHRKQEIEKERARAEEASKAKSAFLASMSHEIRTPMNGVVGMAELLCDSPLTEDQAIFAQTIRSSGEALLTIINDVLDFARGEAGAIRLKPQATDVEGLAADVVDLLRHSAKGKGLTLTLDYDPLTPTEVQVDAGRLRQVLVNLVGNAIKFTHHGGISIRICGTDQNGEAHLHIMVIDTGVGIPPRALESIFDEFQQIDAAQPEGINGTGLGLAITRQLVTAMGGRLWVQSTPNQGSTFGFTLRLPCAASTPPPALDGMAVCVTGFDDPPHGLIRYLRGLGANLSCGRGAIRIVPPGDRTPEDMASAADPYLVFCPAGTVSGPHALRAPFRRRDMLAMLTRFCDKSPDRQMQVLAVDDNPTNRLVLQKMLASFRIRLSLAHDGAAAVAQWRSQRPDLVLMDISMPIMDGKEATRQIRAQESGAAHTPIVALTAYTEADELSGLSDVGLDDILPKPVRRAMLETVLTKFAPKDVISPVPPAAPSALEVSSKIEKLGADDR